MKTGRTRLRVWKIALYNRKGGPGKSTTAICLAVVAAEKQRVAIVDADPQGSVTAWSRRRKGDAPRVLAASLLRLPEALAAADAEGYDGSVVDLPGSYGLDEIDALSRSKVDLVVVPVRPTALDLAASRSTLEALAAQHLRAVVVLTQVRARGRESNEIREALSRSAPVLRSTLGERIAYQIAISGGEGVTEYDPHSLAADEVHALFAEIRRTIRGK